MPNRREMCCSERFLPLCSPVICTSSGTGGVAEIFHSVSKVADVDYALDLLGLHIRMYWAGFKEAWEALPEDYRMTVAWKAMLLGFDDDLADFRRALEEFKLAVARRGATFR